MRCYGDCAIIAESFEVDSRFTGTLDLAAEHGVQCADGGFRIGEGFRVQAYTEIIPVGNPGFGSGVGDPIELEVPFSGNLSDYKKLVITPVAD